LTLPGFLLKFQSNRGRANRFYNAFLCRNFQAPEGGLPAPSDACNDEPDLTQRCGCAFCHSTVEPAAAAWGRWTEAGLAPMAGDEFPRYRDRCDPSSNPRAANDFFCRRFYMIDPVHEKEMAYSGQLISYVFADEHPGRGDTIEAGPRGLAEQAIVSGEFAKCTTQRVWSQFIGREATSTEDEVMTALAQSFSELFTLRDLIRSVVTRPEYRYAGLYEQEVQ
jgi:hypothetical protein